MAPAQHPPVWVTICPLLLSCALHTSLAREPPRLHQHCAHEDWWGPKMGMSWDHVQIHCLSVSLGTSRQTGKWQQGRCFYVHMNLGHFRPPIFYDLWETKEVSQEFKPESRGLHHDGIFHPLGSQPCLCVWADSEVGSCWLCLLFLASGALVLCYRQLIPLPLLSVSELRGSLEMSLLWFRPLSPGCLEP